MHSQVTMALFNAQEYMLPCLNKMFFGVACPGCGLQRSLYLLSKGEFTAAFYMYPGVYPLGIFLLFLLLRFFIKIPYAHSIQWSLLGIMVVTIIVSYALKIASFSCKL